MEEFPDELMAKYTRKELEAMAIDLEIDTMGLSTKAQLADAVFEAKRMMKEIAAEAEPAEKAAEAVPAEKAAEAVPAEKAAEAVPAEKAAEAVPAEKVTKVKLQVSGKGVLAMRAAIEDESLMIQKAGQNMRQEGAEQMRKAIEAQVKENQRSIRNFDHGVEEIRTDIDKKASAIQKAGWDMRQEGAEQMRKAIEAQVKENQRSIKNFDHGVEEIRTDIDEFVKVDLENYVRDFYYG